jgi:predicted dehydrogenase
MGGGNVTTVRFGLVGCGRIGATADDRVQKWPNRHFWLPYSHGGAISAAPGALFAAVCDSDAVAAAAAGRRFGVAKIYSDYEEMLERESLDALAIATRTKERGAILRAAVAHGVRGFYCEKALATSLEETDALTDLIEKSGAAFVYGTKRRFMRVFHQVRDRVRAGEIGDITGIMVRYGYGSLLWSLPHAVDMACFLADDQPVDRVQADLTVDAAKISGLVIDDDPVMNVANIVFANGIRAVLQAGEGCDTEIIGRKGLAIIESDGNKIRWRGHLKDGSDIDWLLEETVESALPDSGTLHSIAALIDAMSKTAEPQYSIRHAQRNQEILFALVESQLADGRMIKLPLARRGLIITGRTGSFYA